MLDTALDIIQEQTLPAGVQDSPGAKVWFEKGKTALKTCHGQMEALFRAYDCFKQSSEAYCYMGIALMLSAASYQAQDSYDPKGLGQAVGWLDKAKTLSHDAFQAGLIEAQLRGYFGQLQKAHDILDKIPECLEVKMIRHGLLSRELRHNEAQRLFAELTLQVQPGQQQELAIAMAWMYLRLSDAGSGRELLEQRLQSNPHDPWLNHTLSLFYWQLGDLKKSRWHNHASLSIKRLPLALELQQELRKVKVFFLRRVLFRAGLSFLVFTAGVRILAISL